MKYIIRVDIGYGDEYEIIDADDQEDADQAAYEIWREAAEQQATYFAEEWTEKLAEEYGLD